VAQYEIQTLSGRLTIELYQLDGQLISSITQANLITNAGKNVVAQLFIGAIEGKADMSIAVGDSSIPVTVQDTALGNQLDEASVAISAINSVTVDGIPRAAVKLSAAFPALESGKSQTLREAGVIMRFSNREPVLYNHVNFADITRTDNVQMTLTWEVLF
jgi:hypothetical protein